MYLGSGFYRDASHVPLGDLHTKNRDKMNTWQHHAEIDLNDTLRGIVREGRFLDDISPALHMTIQAAAHRFLIALSDRPPEKMSTSEALLPEDSRLLQQVLPAYARRIASVMADTNRKAHNGTELNNTPARLAA